MKSIMFVLFLSLFFVLTPNRNVKADEDAQHPQHPAQSQPHEGARAPHGGNSGGGQSHPPSVGDHPRANRPPDSNRPPVSSHPGNVGHNNSGHPTNLPRPTAPSHPGNVVHNGEQNHPGNVHQPNSGHGGHNMGGQPHSGHNVTAGRTGFRGRFGHGNFGYNRGHWYGYPGWSGSWRWNFGWTPGWWYVGISLPSWTWIDGPSGYYECIAVDQNLQTFPAVGPDTEQASYGALYACSDGEDPQAAGCYIPPGYCRVR